MLILVDYINFFAIEKKVTISGVHFIFETFKIPINFLDSSRSSFHGQWVVFIIFRIGFDINLLIFKSQNLMESNIEQIFVS